MQPRITSTLIHLLSALVALLVCCVSVFGESHGRVVVREEMKAPHRAILLEKLRLITGIKQMSFDSDGALVLGSVQVGGSASARDLLRRAVNGKKFIVVEDATNRSDIAFCRVVPGKTTGATISPLPVFVVLIDFEDFKHVSGDARARAAFDVGWGLLHELDHVVAESEDAANSFGAGQCEEHINEMRREVGLPVRSSYFFNSLPTRTDPNFITRLVRLGFVETSRNKTKKYWLIWDAALVGGIDERSQTALVKSSSAQ